MPSGVQVNVLPASTVLSLNPLPTVTCLEAVKVVPSEFVIVAVIVTTPEPELAAVTTPESLTVANDVSLLVHVTVPVALPGSVMAEYEPD